MKKAFTLAEVLITLGIIGIVAAMTMPSLIANHKEKETSVKLKKVYSTLSQAYLSAVNEYGTPDDWDLIGPNDSQGAVNMMEKFAQYMNTTKVCGNDSGCWYNESIKEMNGTAMNALNANNTYGKLQLADGTLMAFVVRRKDCDEIRGNSTALLNSCGAVDVDINGAKFPNQVGRDYFSFYVTKYGIIPLGTQDETTYIFPNDCKKGSNGRACTAWVIFNENMEYLKCDDLSWSGKTKCK